MPLGPSPALGTLFPGPKPRHPAQLLHLVLTWFSCLLSQPSALPICQVRYPCLLLLPLGSQRFPSGGKGPPRDTQRENSWRLAIGRRSRREQGWVWRYLHPGFILGLKGLKGGWSQADISNSGSFVLTQHCSLSPEEKWKDQG